LADIDTCKEFTIKHKELTGLKYFINDEKLQVTNNIKSLEAKVYNDSFYYSESVVQEKLLSLTTELEQTQEYISRLESESRSFVNNISDSNEELNRSLVGNKRANNAKQIEIESILMKMNILSAQVDKALPFFKYIGKRDEINVLLESINKIQRLVLSLDGELRAVEIKLKSRINNFFYTDLITSIYQKIDPHPFFKTVSFECVFPDDERPRLEVYLYEENSLQPISPALYFSSAQLNILSLSIFLAKALHIEHEGLPVKTILIDDPIHSMDSINVLSVIDLLRNISVNFDRQIVLSTHDENFYELLKLKIPEDKFGSKFIRFKSFGIVHNDKRSVD
jgi:exonuclease SbcC